MKGTSRDVPVHESLQVIEVTTLYQTEEWWKAVVTYQFEDTPDTDETAVYLWHQDDGWTRKNKYVVKSSAGWATDREIIDRYIRSDPPSDSTSAFPVSDYYIVGEGESVFQSNGWWKAIVNVVEKGSYDTNEVMVYLWQKRDDEWNRRQKYAVKSVSNWEDEREVVDDHLSISGISDETRSASDLVSDELSELSDELDAHLSEEFR